MNILTNKKVSKTILKYFLFKKEFFCIREIFIKNINGLKQEIQGINSNNIQ
jgi:hypothetical protein